MSANLSFKVKRSLEILNEKKFDQNLGDEDKK